MEEKNKKPEDKKDEKLSLDKAYIKEESKSKENKSSEKDIKKKNQSINNENSSINTKNNQDAQKKMNKEEKTEKEIKKEGVIKKVFIIIIIAVIALLIFILIKDFFNVGEITFKYHNLTFSKTRFEGIVQYKTTIGFRADGKLINHEITIRNHPKDLEKIPANITGTVLKNTYVSFQKSLVEECSGDVQLAGFRLGYDLFGALKKLLPNIDLGSGLFDLDENATEKEKVKLKNCLDASDQTMVFLFQQGNENKIYPDEEYENCYHAEIKDCESVLLVSERLLIVILDKLRGYEE